MVSSSSHCPSSREEQKPVHVHDFLMGLADMARAEGDGRILFVIAALIAIVGIAISFHGASTPRRPG
jgi:multisubunit Na+/H+ antiporter MnhB subunit